MVGLGQKSGRVASFDLQPTEALWAGLMVMPINMLRDDVEAAEKRREQDHESARLSLKPVIDTRASDMPAVLKLCMNILLRLFHSTIVRRHVVKYNNKSLILQDYQ